MGCIYREGGKWPARKRAKDNFRNIASTVIVSTVRFTSYQINPSSNGVKRPGSVWSLLCRIVASRYCVQHSSGALSD
eukprot:scaffold82154_cov18-Prasinocladus_malaysianus.AAC.1